MGATLSRAGRGPPTALVRARRTASPRSRRLSPLSSGPLASPSPPSSPSPCSRRRRHRRARSTRACTRCAKSRSRATAATRTSSCGPRWGRRRGMEGTRPFATTSNGRELRPERDAIVLVGRAIASEVRIQSSGLVRSARHAGGRRATRRPITPRPHKPHCVHSRARRHRDKDGNEARGTAPFSPRVRCSLRASALFSRSLLPVPPLPSRRRRRDRRGAADRNCRDRRAAADRRPAATHDPRAIAKPDQPTRTQGAAALLRRAAGDGHRGRADPRAALRRALGGGRRRRRDLEPAGPLERAARDAELSARRRAERASAAPRATAAPRGGSPLATPLAKRLARARRLANERTRVVNNARLLAPPPVNRARCCSR